MYEQTSLLGQLQDAFTLSSRAESTLQELLDAAHFDRIHFFIEDALRSNSIPAPQQNGDKALALFQYTPPEGALTDEIFDEIEYRGFTPATLHDLLNLAIQRPNLQRNYDIIALGTLRTRRLFKERPGETVWDQQQRDRTICQWATGLSATGTQRTLVPMQLYLDQLLRRPTLILVRTTQNQ